MRYPTLRTSIPFFVLFALQFSCSGGTDAANPDPVVPQQREPKDEKPLDTSICTKEKADEIDLNQQPVDLSGRIGGAQEDEDTKRYCIILEQHSKMSFILGGHSDYLNLEIHNDTNEDGALSEEELLWYTEGSSQLELEPILERGVYVISVREEFGASDTENEFSLKISAEEKPTMEEDPGAEPKDAALLENWEGAQVIQDFVGETDKYDTFKFSFTSHSIFAIDTSDLEDKIQIYLYQDHNKDGILAESEKVWSREYLRWSIARGDYFLVVHAKADFRDSNTTYTISLTNTTAPALEVDPGDSPDGSAQDLGVLGANATVRQDYVGYGDTDDYYRFSLPKETTVTAELSDLQEDITVSLVQDTNNDGILGSDETLEARDGSQPRVSQILPPGTYFIRVEGAWWLGNQQSTYTLSAMAQ